MSRKIKPDALFFIVSVYAIGWGCQGKGAELLELLELLGKLLQIDALNCDAKNGQERAAVGEAAEAIADGPFRVKGSQRRERLLISRPLPWHPKSLRTIGGSAGPLRNWEPNVWEISYWQSYWLWLLAIGYWLQISGLKSVAKVFHLFPLLSDPMGKSSSLFFLPFWHTFQWDSTIVGSAEDKKSGMPKTRAERKFHYP